MLEARCQLFKRAFKSSGNAIFYLLEAYRLLFTGTPLEGYY